jgi:hypothetical protein
MVSHKQSFDVMMVDQWQTTTFVVAYTPVTYTFKWLNRRPLLELWFSSGVAMVGNRTHGPSYEHAGDKLVVLTQFSALFALKDGREERTSDFVECLECRMWSPLIFNLSLRSLNQSGADDVITTKQYQHFPYKGLTATL